MSDIDLKALGDQLDAGRGREVFTPVERRLMMLALHAYASRTEANHADTQRLNWFEQRANEGACPALLNDDNGHWAVAFDGHQNVPMEDGPVDIETAFYVEAAKWKPTVREAIDAAREYVQHEGSKP